MKFSTKSFMMCMFLVKSVIASNNDVIAPDSSFHDWAKEQEHTLHEKALKNEKNAGRIEAAAIATKGSAFLAELAGFSLFGLPGIYAGLTIAGVAYGYENDAKKMEEVTERFRAAVKTLEDNPTLGNDKFKAVFDSSKKKSCKKSCSSSMGKHNANDLSEISWCVLNCPPIILRDYMCEVFGNATDNLPKSKHKQEKFTPKKILIPQLAQLFADPFVKIYRDILHARMLNRYYRGDFSISLIGKLRRFTTVADRMENADFWDPDTNSEPSSIVDSLRGDAPLIQDIRMCFGSLCYTTQPEYEHELNRALTSKYYEKYDILRQMAGRKSIPQSGLISLEELQLQENPQSPTTKPPFPAPFQNYCSYYFSRVPVNFHSRLANMAKLQFYKSYFNGKIKERYKMIKDSQESIKEFIKAFDSQEAFSTLEAKTKTLKHLMESVSSYADALKAGQDLSTWKTKNHKQYEMLIEAGYLQEAVVSN